MKTLSAEQPSSEYQKIEFEAVFLYVVSSVSIPVCVYILPFSLLSSFHSCCELQNYKGPVEIVVLPFIHPRARLCVCLYTKHINPSSSAFIECIYCDLSLFLFYLCPKNEQKLSGSNALCVAVRFNVVVGVVVAIAIRRRSFLLSDCCSTFHVYNRTVVSFMCVSFREFDSI